jgi:DNA-binding NarL/FixJ family response regulator
MKTLIVEDNAFFRQTLSGILRARFPGMLVDEAEDGVEALAKVGRFQPDLIVMAIHLPGECGLDLCRCIRTHRPELPIVICASHDLPEYREAARRHGATHFVETGGSSIHEILSLIDRLVFLQTGIHPGEASPRSPRPLRPARGAAWLPLVPKAERHSLPGRG